MSKRPDPPPIRPEIIDKLYNMIDNVILHFLKKRHPDMTNEELDVVFNRLVAFHRQQEIHMYALYVWDLKMRELEGENVSETKPPQNFYR